MSVADSGAPEADHEAKEIAADHGDTRHYVRRYVVLSSALSIRSSRFPLYIINSVDLYFPEHRSTPVMTLSAVVLSHVSCAINPVM